MKQAWWKEAIVYQVYPRSFADQNGDGIGDIAGIISKLDYLAELGIDTLWISPVYESPMDDNGYDISNYQAIANEFGTMEDMKQLISEAESRGIRILMDLVVNHTSDEHAWFEESRRSCDAAKRDWYIWRDPSAEGGAPNNLRSIFGGSCWEFDETTEQYYFHTFSKKQPDLNWENEGVRKAIYDMITWWLDLGIAGFRVDAITFIKKPDLSLSVEPDGADGLAIVKPNHPGIELFLQEMKEQAFDGRNLFTVAEAPGVHPDELPRFAGENGFFSMLIEFAHMDLDIGPEGRWYEPVSWEVQDFKRAIDQSQQVVNGTAWSALYLENHDQPRSLNKFIPQEFHHERSAKMLATAYFLLRGTPFIYQGQEIGMENVSYPSIDHYDDLSTIDQFQAALQSGIAPDRAFELVAIRSRDNSRTPMQWNDRPHGGFSAQEPWLAVNDNYLNINVATALNDEKSIFYYYKKLIQLRKNSPYKDVLLNGRYEPVETEHHELFVYKRTLNEQTLLIINNFSNETCSLPSVGKQRKVVLSNYGDEGGEIVRPFESLVLSLS